MPSYQRATLSRRPKRKNWYVFCTIPVELRQYFSNKKQLYRSTGETEREFARDKLRSIEAQIWNEFDEAQIEKHPLSVAFANLAKSFYDFDPSTLPSNDVWAISNLFEDEKRLDIASHIRWDLSTAKAEEALAGMYEQSTHFIDWIKIHELHSEFEYELEMLNRNRFVAKPKSCSFNDVASEYLASPTFLRNKRDNSLKREKTITDQRNKLEVFQKWAGDITLTDMNNRLAYSYMDALSDPSLNLISTKHPGSEVGVETLKKYFQPVRAVLDFAFRNDYTERKLWSDLSFSGYGAKSRGYRDILEDELVKLFSLNMPDEDRLCFALLFVTGARLEEIASVRWDQIKEDIVADERVVWLETFDAIVKNDASRRAIPLHPSVVSLLPERGFSWNKKDNGRLFSYPVTGADGKVSNKASQALMRHLKKIKADSSDTRLVVHSFRHTFNTMCRNAGIDWELREFIVGRSAGGGVSASYGTSHSVYNQMQAIKKLDVDFILR